MMTVRRKQKTGKKENKRKSSLVQFIDDTQINSIQGKNTAFTIWNALKARHEKKGNPGHSLV